MFERINSIAKANATKVIFSKSFTDFENTHYKLIGWECLSICHALALISSFDWEYDICYDDENILFYRKDFFMKATYTIIIPYGERSKYFDAMIEINHVVGKNGTCALFVNNIPYKLEALFIVDLDTANEQIILEIESIIKSSNLEIINDKGKEQLLGEMQARKWNCVFFPLKCPTLKEKLKAGFIYTEKSELRQLGYDVDYDLKRPKLFISYSHKDKTIVHSIVESLKRSGMNVWLDEQEIDLGDNILQRISDGIRECDFGLLFLSNHTLYAKGEMHEIFTFFQKSLYSQKKIIPILLDNVNPDSLIEGLSLFKYYNYTENGKIDDLIEGIRIAIAK